MNSSGRTLGEGSARLLRWALLSLLPLLFGVFAYIGQAAPISDSCRLLGLPFSDAQGYLDGALRLTSGLRLPEFAARRPLFAGYLSTWFEVTGFSITWALIGQAILIASAISWFCLHVALRHGRLVAVLAGFIIAAFFVRFAGKTLTETIGLPLALLAWGLLLKWDAKQHASDLILGYFALTLGLLARAGPFFILPALLLVLKRRSDKRSFLLQTGALLSVAGLAFAISRAYQARLAGPDSLPFSNFAYTLYGVARGGKGWIYSTQVLPHSTPQLVYQSAIDSIRHEPHLFALGALKGLWDFFLPNLLCATGFACRIVPSKLQPLVWLLTQVGFLVGLWALIRKKTSVGSSSRDLYLSGMLGLILSVPFAPPIDADLMRAHTMAIPLIAIVTALGIETIVRRLAASSLGPALARLAEPARELSVRAERRIFESFPYVVLFLVLAFVIRPLARSVRMDASVSGTGELAAQGHRTRPTDTGGCSGAQSYPVTLDHVMDGPLIDSVERVERLLGRSRLSPALLQPLKPVFQRVGIFEFAYAFVRETGNTWAVLLPRQIMARSFDGHESVSVCAEEVDAPLTQDGQLRALLITTTR